MSRRDAMMGCLSGSDVTRGLEWRGGGIRGSWGRLFEAGGGSVAARGWCQCGSTSVTWFEASGRGTVYSCTVTRRIPGSWRAATPFVLAYVELDEGPRVATNVVGCDPETVHIGQAVRTVFDPTPDGPALLRFTPA